MAIHGSLLVMNEEFGLEVTGYDMACLVNEEFIKIKEWI
jgi:hypothetical protein